jgi:branched-chain amino acid transport system substrate-binding protein
MHTLLWRIGFRVGSAGLAIALLACTAAGPAARPAAQQAEPYRVGITAALTGPLADNYAPVYEAINVYVQRLNDQGGINGHPVQLLVEDDSGDGTKANSNATKLIQQEQVSLLLVTSVSATYGPILNIARAASTPVLFASVCPREAFPPADPWVFCSGSYGALYDPAYAVQFIKEAAREAVSLGLVAQDIPLSRTAMDYAAQVAGELGLAVVSRVTIPPTATDYTPFATQLQQAGANWVFAHTPWSTEIGVFDALQKLGWRGNYLLWAHQPAEEELARRKTDALFALAGNALFAENLPIHQEIRAAVATYKTTYPIEHLAEGWSAALALEQGLRQCGWPCGPRELQAAFNQLNVDMKGLRGGPLTFSPDNHYRPKTYYKVYRWDNQQSRIVTARDWAGLDVVPGL